MTRNALSIRVPFPVTLLARLCTRSRVLSLGFLLGAVQILCASVPAPYDWVPARWPSTDPASLDLLHGSSVNCLLLRTYTAEFDAAAQKRGIAPLAVITPGGDVIAAARKGLEAQIAGIVLEGDFPESAAATVRKLAGGVPVIELTSRNSMPLGSKPDILGTYQGVWPGIAAEQESKHAGPTASAWIDTNTGFLRAVRAWGNVPLWIANEPPANTVVTAERYMQAIADAAASGARWVLAFDPDFYARWQRRDAKTMADWKRIDGILQYFERHPEWRTMPEFGRLAVVQDPAKGGLVSGGILDMIAVKHTPVRAVPLERLTPEALQGASMAVDVDASALTDQQKEILRNFAHSGGALLTGPPDWKDEKPPAGRITLDKQQLERVNDMWRDLNSMIGRKNLGVRLFNVASMLSNALVSADGKTQIVHLVNYADYPVDSVTVHFLGEFKRATLLTPEGDAKSLAIYQTEDGSGVDIDRVAVCATIKLEQ